MADSENEYYQLLMFQIKVHKCVKKVIPCEKIQEAFLSYRGEGALPCLISHVYWIFKLSQEIHAYELTLAFIEAGIAYNSVALTLQAVDTYLRRPDADLRVVPHFERRADFLRTISAQFMLRLTILHCHDVHLESLCSEAEKLIEFLAESAGKKHISMAQLSKMKNSPSLEKAEVRLSTSGRMTGSRKAQKDEVRDGTQSE